MKLLFDQNLSWRLVAELRDLFPESLHVRNVGLDRVTDEDVWKYAIANDFVIISKDSDFEQGNFLPQIAQMDSRYGA